MKRLLPLVFFFVGLFAAPHTGAEGIYGVHKPDPLCEQAWAYNLDPCRQERDSPSGKPPHGTPYEKVWSVHRSFSGPDGRSVCANGAWDSGGDLAGQELIELAKQQCNRHNVTLKKDLVECFEKGIWIKTNEDPAEACPKGDEVDVHEIGEDALCEILHNPIRKMDPGNGFFETCEATGPGPIGFGHDESEPPDPENPPSGCCRVLNIHNARHGRGFEFAGHQKMKTKYRPDNRMAKEEWNEKYFTRTDAHEIWMCNPVSTPPNVTLTHYYCAETSQDIMVEGWQNPSENPAHRGTGWCNVTTGDYRKPTYQPEDPDDPRKKVLDIDQIFGDLVLAIDYMGQKKGIINPHHDPTYEKGKEDAKWECTLTRDQFDLHCSDAEIVSTRQFAHSMGAIAQAVWGIPFDYFGGSVTGPPDEEEGSDREGGGFRNNCDPVPEVVDIVHPLAIYFKTREKIPVASTVDRQKSVRKNTYRWCNDTNVLTNCVRRNATIVGRPLGPEGCGANGTQCQFAPWCGDNNWSPYNGTLQEQSGRQEYAPSLCQDIASALISRIQACLQLDGVGALVECVVLAYNVYRLAHDPPLDLDDHAFDDPNDWGGYRVLTKPNWDVPRREHDRGAVVTHVGPSDPGVCENDSMSVPKWYCHIE